MIISLKTCTAVKEQCNNKLSYTVASRWSFLLEMYYDAWNHEFQMILLYLQAVLWRHTHHSKPQPLHTHGVQHEKKKLICTTNGTATMTLKPIFYTPLNSSIEKIKLEICLNSNHS